MDGRRREDRRPINWGLIGLIGLSVEFWVVLVALTSAHLP